MEGLGRVMMKVVILAGGMGTRLSEETISKPKPLIEIGERPILWHIMKTYAFFGFTEFVICCGYKGNMIKKYFINYGTYESATTFCLKEDSAESFAKVAEPWKVTLANTGLKTLTAGRILKIKEYVGDEPFLLTYGDGVADVNINKLIETHRTIGKIATITTVKPEGRFGIVKLREEDGSVEGFQEKARGDQGWVNIGFMVMEPEIFDYLGNGQEMLEASPFEKLVRKEQMHAYRHNGFWSPMDNMRDKSYLENLWNTGKALWKVWE